MKTNQISENLFTFGGKDKYSKNITVCNRTHVVIRQIESFLNHLKSLKYSPQSLDAVRNALNRFARYLIDQHLGRIQDVTLVHLEQYRLALLEDNLKPASVFLYLRFVRKLFAFLEQSGQLFTNPAAKLKLPKVRYPLQPVPDELEVEALLSKPDPGTAVGIRDRALLETLYSTGIRLSELTQINLIDVDDRNAVIQVTGKGDKQRTVPLGKKARHWISLYLKEARPRLLRNNPDEPALWIGRTAKRINPLIVERTVKNYGKKARIKTPVTPHALRRACATHMLQNGAHPVQLQMLLGHASLSSRSQYLQVTVPDMLKMHCRGKPGKSKPSNTMFPSTLFGENH